MLFLNNPFTREVTEFTGSVIKEVNVANDKIYLDNGAIIKQNPDGKYFDISTSEKYATVFEAGSADEIGAIVGYAMVNDSAVTDHFGF